MICFENIKFQFISPSAGREWSSRQEKTKIEIKIETPQSHFGPDFRAKILHIVSSLHWTQDRFDSGVND